MDKTQSFAQLGIPFPLYEAAVETCSDFIGRGECSVCARDEQWIFDASGELVVACSKCGRNNALTCVFKADSVCTNCAAPVVWPLARASQITVCYDCLRAGRVYLNHDMALGLIEWKDAERGWIEFYRIDDLDPIIVATPVEGEEMMRRYEFGRGDLVELGRTPVYSTWQSERWLFHCGHPMVYLGQPLESPESEVAPEIAAALREVVQSQGWDFEPWADESSRTCVYLFRCQICGGFGGHSDCD